MKGIISEVNCGFMENQGESSEMPWHSLRAICSVLLQLIAISKWGNIRMVSMCDQSHVFITVHRGYWVAADTCLMLSPSLLWGAHRFPRMSYSSASSPHNPNLQVYFNSSLNHLRYPIKYKFHENSFILCFYFYYLYCYYSEYYWPMTESVDMKPVAVKGQLYCLPASNLFFLLLAHSHPLLLGLGVSAMSPLKWNYNLPDRKDTLGKWCVNRKGLPFE